ncbi:transposase [Roseofilum sp. BLCC_M143]|uniref:Transposase n=1 Tax=Roseofilum casamattae BLCC-M143 TaxID=3022442 RepID=A0ABT7C1A8_9CYAN|nr:transposase [Roseofilum casamattae BLCC-M143]
MIIILNPTLNIPDSSGSITGCSQYLSPYSPDFNPIELWWSQLKSFLRSFAQNRNSLINKVQSQIGDVWRGAGSREQSQCWEFPLAIDRG